MASKIKVQVLGLSFSNSRGENIPYIVIIGKPEDKIRIPIIIGASEAQSIAIALEKVPAPRPLSHDIFATLSREFNVEVSEVIIYEYSEGVFLAKLVCKNEISVKEIECRPSDGIAIALRMNIPIYTYQHIFDEAGVSIEDKKAAQQKRKIEKEEEEEKKPIEELNIKQLQKRLKKAIDTENYELASQINERIKTLSNKL
ncbi:MAG: bifunctional nuclease family protein [Muribaculaceae bacterium]|nr:bifunctional nuclease family protein [Muribaculaceae bacterium]